VSRKRAGAGLGLAISRRLAEMHGGAIRLRSTPGQGTVATLWLPPQRLQ
jgi:two-component system cell cycle sensor histidine kinase PleC